MQSDEICSLVAFFTISFINKNNHFNPLHAAETKLLKIEMSRLEKIWKMEKDQHEIKHFTFKRITTVIKKIFQLRQPNLKKLVPSGPHYMCIHKSSPVFFTEVTVNICHRRLRIHVRSSNITYYSNFHYSSGIQTQDQSDCFPYLSLGYQCLRPLSHHGRILWFFLDNMKFCLVK